MKSQKLPTDPSVGHKKVPSLNYMEVISTNIQITDGISIICAVGGLINIYDIIPPMKSIMKLNTEITYLIEGPTAMEILNGD